MITTFSLYAQIGCDSATVVTNGVTLVPEYTHPYDTTIENCAGVSDSVVWFSYTATNDTFIRIVAGGFAGAYNEDTRLSLYVGECGNLTCFADDDDSGPGLSAQLDIEVTAGETYYLVFDSRYSHDTFSFLIQDLFVPASSLYFEPVGLSRSGSLRAGVDMNGDYLDDIVCIESNNVHIQYQNASGEFEEVNIPTEEADHLPGWSLTAGDLNGDGYNDLVYGGGSGTTFMISDGNNGFVENTPEMYIFCQRGNCVDINNDGLLDVFMCHDVRPNVFFINEDNGSYEPNQGGLGDTPSGGNYGSIWIDYDNDRDMDLFIAKCRGGGSDANINQLHRNNGDGTFTEIAEEMNLADPIQTWSSAWGDYDNDGDMDVFVGASSLWGDQYHRLMRNDDSTFTDVSIGSGVETVFSTSIENITHDFNNDGYLDIYGAGDVMFLNNGNMTFSPISVDVGFGPVGDFNNDGFLDIVRESGGQSRVYMNSGNDNNYIKLTVLGTVSNRNGIGARVEVYTENGKQIRDVRSGDGFRYMSSLNVHFGIGEATEIEKVKVYWPSGIVDEILNPSVNATLHVIEGASPSSVQQFAPEEIILYPNPTAGTIHIPADLVAADVLIDIFDANGRLVIRKELNNNAIEVATLPSGQYQLVYRSADAIRVGKFIKR